MTIYILGGGPTALALSDGLLDSKIPFVVIEKEPEVGGLSQTLKWDNHGFHDLGPHKIFSLNKPLMARVKNLLKSNDWLVRPKKSSIYIKKHFLPYPPSPFSLISIYGPIGFLGKIFDLIIARIHLKKENTELTFEKDLKARLGQGIYETLFKPIALKLWGDPTKLDVSLSKSRVQTPSLFEVIVKTLKIRTASKFEALEFYYPKGGLQRVWEAILSKSQNQGRFLVNKEVFAIIAEDSIIKRIRYKDRITKKEEEIILDKDDVVVSTLPLQEIPKLMGNGINSTTAEKIKKGIQLNDLIMIFFKIDKQSLLDDSWVFIPDSEIIFHRLSEQESFDPGMTPNGSIVCCEIMSNPTRPMNKLSDEELIASTKKGLADMGYDGFSIIDQRVIRLPLSYPVFWTGFSPILSEILDYLDQFKNFRTIGRQGSFSYIGTLDAMDIGYGMARWLINRKEGDADIMWKEERKRTSYYPVLD
ncbi:MAG: hypothetical protein QME07_00185 [bacterium]|nr:hypothetical protein [bacterium]